MISRSYIHMRKTTISIWDHFGTSLYTQQACICILCTYNQNFCWFRIQCFFNLLFFITSHIQTTSQELLHNSIGMSRSNYFRHKPGLYNKNYSPQPLLAPSLDSDTRESAGYSSEGPPQQKTVLRAPINHGSHQVRLSSCEALCVQAEGFPFKLSKYQHYVHSANNLPKGNERNTTKVIALTQGGQIFSCGFEREDCLQWINGL